MANDRVDPLFNCLPAMVADAADYGVDPNAEVGGPRLSDAHLTCFVQWCRANPWSIVGDPIIARRVLAAYMGATDVE